VSNPHLENVKSEKCDKRTFVRALICKVGPKSINTTKSKEHYNALIKCGSASGERCHF